MRLALALVCTLTATARADFEIKNDSFAEGATVAFQGGFVTGEIGASQFVAPEAGRQLKKVQLLFGEPGAGGELRTVTVIVYDDTPDTVIPGPVLYRGDFQVASSMSALHDLPIDDMVVTLPQRFRIGIQPLHDNAPGIAADTDAQQSAKNFIFALSPQGDRWLESAMLGVQGDWIIRAVVSGTGGGPIPTTCAANPDCPAGEYCDLEAGTCTFDCTEDAECNGGTCNSLGQCVGGGDGGGCCDARHDTGAATALGVAGFGLLLLRRRRCAR